MAYTLEELIDEAARLREISERQFEATYGVHPTALRAIGSSASSGAPRGVPMGAAAAAPTPVRAPAPYVEAGMMPAVIPASRHVRRAAGLGQARTGRRQEQLAWAARELSDEPTQRLQLEPGGLEYEMPRSPYPIEEVRGRLADPKSLSRLRRVRDVVEGVRRGVVEDLSTLPPPERAQYPIDEMRERLADPEAFSNARAVRDSYLRLIEFLTDLTLGNYGVRAYQEGRRPR